MVILNFVEQLSLRMRQYSSSLDDCSALERLVNNPRFAKLSTEDQEKGIQIAQAKDEQQLMEQAAYHTPNQFGFSQTALEQANKMMHERLAQNQNQSRSLG